MPDRFSRPALDDADPQAKPLTVPQARDALVQAADRYRAEGSEKAAWALEAACWKLLAAIYDLEGIL